MSAHYAPLPNPRSVTDPDGELNAAFESDNEDDHFDTESTPLTRGIDSHSFNPLVPSEENHHEMGVIPGSYDFERDYDYDYPPPGSPPQPSAFALPNDHGNSNGQMPTSPAPSFSPPRPSFFRRAVGAILPTHYTRVPVEPHRTRGGGIENDGVFANVMAKPGRARTLRTENGEVHMVPEEVQSEAPPSYTDAQADAVPPYWETTVHTSALDPDSDMIIDDLPTGSFFIFAANLFTSFFFQFVGFLLTYLLHTSHAAKYGSRAGLGLTLIQYGFYSRQSQVVDEISGGTDDDSLGWPLTPDASSDPPLLSTSPPTDYVAPDNSALSIASKEWLSFLLMTLGWFLLLSSLVGYWRVKRWERSIRSSATPGPSSREEIENDIAIRRNLHEIFGFGLSPDEAQQEQARNAGTAGNIAVNMTGIANVDSSGNVIVIPDRQALEEARLARDLRAAGLL